MERFTSVKFDPSRTPSKLYTEYAKPVFVNPQPPAPHIVPANIQSYLDNTEPLYQNEAPRKFYELVTPQKFTKTMSVKLTDSFKSPRAEPVPLQVASSPDVKEEKKKKWSLGGLFRRRKKESESDTSSQEEEQKMGFLARRRSRREKRKQRANKVAAGFDHIVKPQEKPRSRTTTSPVELSQDSLTKSPEVSRASRDSLTGSHDRLSRYQDSSLSGSGSLEGLSRRERRSVIKQRAEAQRPRGSSSDEEKNSLHRSGSLNRRSRFARTERYIKRLSREEEAVLQREAMEKQRLCLDGSDCDPRYLMTSATPSPGQSPMIQRSRMAHHPPMSLSNPASLERKSHQNARASKCYSVRGTSPLPPNHPQRPDHFQHPSQRSLSYDNDIHRLNAPASPDDNVMVVQFPVARLFQNRTVKPGPPPPPPRDPRRVTPSLCQDPARPMSYAFDDGARRGQSGSFLSLNNHPMVTPQVAAMRCNSVEHVRIRQRPASVTPADVRAMPGGRMPVATPRAPFQYFADQTPRSRKPIHIQASQQEQYQPPAQHPPHEQPYLSDSQMVVVKPPQSRTSVSQATEFWRQKELECVKGKLSDRSPSPRLKVKHDSLSSLGSDASNSHESLANSDSLRRKDQRPLSIVVETHEQLALNGDPSLRLISPKMRYLQELLPGARFTQDPSKPAENIKPVLEQNQKVKSSPDVYRTPKIAEPSADATTKQSALKSTPTSTEACPKFMSAPVDYSTKTSPTQIKEYKSKFAFPEPPITAKDFAAQNNPPPAPPVRRFSRQFSNSSLEEKEPRQSNLEDALDELEAIYQSLRLGDEDLLDRAERRDLPTKFQLQRDTHFPGSMSDSGYDLTPMTVRKRAPPSKRSGVPDKVTDDMAYRRLHPKDRPNSQNIISQAGSFLLTSPVLSEASSCSQGLDQEHLKNNEPDITYDDVVYRNIRHANNSLKVAEPQPLFGIPLGPVTPSPNNDYLHSKPSDRYRPTFRPRRTPDVVSDDLAYRNLRKDNFKDASLLTAVENALHDARLKDSNFSLRKRRAVRSLSANLPSLIGHDKALSIVNVSHSENNNFEKAQSLTHLPDALEIAQKILEGKEVIGGGTTHLWANGNTPNPDRNSLGMSTSTETLTDSRANLSLSQDVRNKRNSWQQKLRVNIPSADPPRLPPSERKNLDENVLPPSECSVTTSQASTTVSSPVYDHAKVTPIFEHSGGLPIPDSVPGSPLDEAQLEDLLSALAREARVTSEQLGKQLAGFKTRTRGDISDDSLDSLNNVDVVDSLSTTEIESSMASVDQSKLSLTSDKPIQENQMKQVVSLGNVRTAAIVIETNLSDDIEEMITAFNIEATQGSHLPTSISTHLEPLHIYEPQDLIADVKPNVTTPKVTVAESSDSLSDVDQEVEAILHWENNKNFEKAVNMNNNNEIQTKEDEKEDIAPVPKPRTRNGSEVGKQSTSREGEATCTVGRKSGGVSWLGQEQRNVMMACTYCIACTQQMIGLDWLTVFGILVAIVALLAILMLYR